jgi:hypothetical protein
MVGENINVKQAGCVVLLTLRVVKAASGTQVRGFKPGRSRRIFSGVKILSVPSFGRKVNLLAAEFF